MPIKRTPHGEPVILMGRRWSAKWSIEEQVQEWLIQEGLPRPTREHRPFGKRRWRFDLAWPVEKVALEIDGGTWSQGRHTRGLGFENDLRKINEASADGWCVLRATTSMIDKEWPEILRILKAVLELRGQWSERKR